LKLIGSIPVRHNGDIPLGTDLGQHFLSPELCDAPHSCLFEIKTISIRLTVYGPTRGLKA